MLMRVEKLFKRFGGDFLAITDVNLEFDKGVLTSIIGPNGAGKTTLINLLSGSLAPDSGRILFQDRSINHLSIEERVDLGICRSFQITNIFPDLTVLNNLQIPLIYRHKRNFKLFSRLRSEKSIESEAREILNDMGLADRWETKAAQLSHGEQRQLEIGIALATRPKMIFLDEPTQGMNNLEKSAIMENVVRFSKEGLATFVVVEHDMDVVFSISQRIVVLHSGSVIAEGTPGEIRKNELVRKVYLGEEL